MISQFDLTEIHCNRFIFGQNMLEGNWLGKMTHWRVANTRGLPKFASVSEQNYPQRELTNYTDTTVALVNRNEGSNSSIIILIVLIQYCKSHLPAQTTAGSTTLTTTTTVTTVTVTTSPTSSAMATAESPMSSTTEASSAVQQVMDEHTEDSLALDVLDVPTRY